MPPVTELMHCSFCFLQVTPKSAGLNPNANVFQSKSPNTPPESLAESETRNPMPNENTTIVLKDMPGEYVWNQIYIYIYMGCLVILSTHSLNPC